MLNIVLIGMRGSGKSTIAVLLAAELNKNSVDLDESLVEKTGIKIPEIIKQYGWSWMRDRECEIVCDVAGSSGKVIATGGGVVLQKKNMKALAKNGFVIYLQASLPTLLKRIGTDPNRPPLNRGMSPEDELSLTFAQRDPLYRQWAQLEIDTDLLSARDTVMAITAIVKGL